MQTSSIRTSAIALCALAGLTTACEQNNLTRQPPTSPDSDPGTSTASAREEMSARDGAVSALAATQSSRPETLKPESTRIKTSLGSLPTLNSRRYLPLPQTESILPRLNLTPAIVPRSTWRPSPSATTPMPTLPTAASQSSLMAVVPSQPGMTNPASLPGVSSAPASLAASQPAPQSVASSGMPDVQGHWSQPIVTELFNANIVQGFADGSFRPDAPITEEQFVGMVQRAFPDEAISPASIHLRPGMTRAEAAKVVYQALAEQGKMPSVAALVAIQSQPLNIEQVAGQAGSPNAPIANPSPQPSIAQPPIAQPTVMQPAVSEASGAPTEASAIVDSDRENSLRSEAIAPPMLQAAGLTAEAVQPALATSVSADSRPSPSLGVSVAVMGEVLRPGGYGLVGADGKPTLIQAIQMAGGVTSTANIRQIQVHRAGTTLTVDLWQVLQKGNLDQELTLQSGDMIAIPRATNLAAAEDSQPAAEASDRIQVSVVGEVNNPGLLELPPNALANQAIMASGGFNRQAQKADLIRLNANGTIVRRAITVDVAQGTTDRVNPRLQNNDVILVQRSDGTAIADQWTALNPLMRILPIAETLQ